MALNDDLAKELKRYQYAELAANSLKGEDALSAGICLEKLAGDIGLQKSSEGYGFLESSLASEDGIKAATEIYFKKYQKAYEKATIGDLWDVYQSNFNDNEKELYGAKMRKYSKIKLKDLQSKLKSDKDKIKKFLEGGTATDSSKISKLQAEIRDCEEILGLMESAKQLNYVTLNEPVQKEATKKQKKAIKSNMQKIIGL